MVSRVSFSSLYRSHGQNIGAWCDWHVNSGVRSRLFGSPARHGSICLVLSGIPVRNLWTSA